MKIDKDKKFLIVGLGLLGGCYAMALKKKGFYVTAITKEQADIDYALAEKLSFTDIYSFSRFFKNETHLSPTGYRKNFID